MRVPHPFLAARRVQRIPEKHEPRHAECIRVGGHHL